MIDLACIGKTHPQAETGESPTCFSTTKAAGKGGDPARSRMDVLLDKAVRVFCDQGYHGISIADLMDVMACAAFKDKPALFRAVFDREVAKYLDKLQSIISSVKSGADRLRDALILAAENSQGVKGRHGCLLMNSAAELSAFDAGLAEHVAAALNNVEMLLADLVRQGQADGSIRDTLNVMTTARLLMCVIQGMHMVGKRGQSQAEAVGVVDIVMKLLR